MRLPATWTEARLTDVCELNPRLEERPADATLVSFVPMSAVDEADGVIREKLVRPFAEVSKGYTTFKDGDVLFAKVTPCMENGKAAVARDLESGLGFGSTEFHVLRPNEEVLPELLLSLIRQDALRQRAAAAFVGTGGLQRVPADFLARLKLPLPTMPEQQRIIEILNHVYSALAEKRSSLQKFDELIRTAYWEFFGGFFKTEGIVDGVRIRECVDDVQYGISEPLNEQGSHAVLRMNSITTGGWLDLSDLKYADISAQNAAVVGLRDGDLLFNRTNSRELVGKCALWRPVQGSFSFASYLVRIRLKPDMLPEFLWATLNSAYGKYRMFNAAKQAVSMANISPTDLGRIVVPLPPLDLQRKFSLFVQQVEELRSEAIAGLYAFQELAEVTAQQALVGDVTTNWRAENIVRLKEAAEERSRRFRDRGIDYVQKQKPALEPDIQAPASPTARRWLFDQLSDFQRHVYLSFHDYCERFGQPLLAEDAEAFASFCDDEVVSERLEAFGPALNNRIRRCLSQLSSLGLIAKVTISSTDPETGDREFLKAFRPLRHAELTRMADLQELQLAWADAAGEKHHTIFVHVDTETAERAGAAGMFQVISLEDEEGVDFTHLIEPGNFYSSMAELTRDIASALRTSVETISLETV